MHCFRTELSYMATDQFDYIFALKCYFLALYRVTLNVNILILMNKLRLRMFAGCDVFEIFIGSSFATNSFNLILKLHRM